MVYNLCVHTWIAEEHQKEWVCCMNGQLFHGLAPVFGRLFHKFDNQTSTLPIESGHKVGSWLTAAQLLTRSSSSKSSVFPLNRKASKHFQIYPFSQLLLKCLFLGHGKLMGMEDPKAGKRTCTFYIWSTHFMCRKVLQVGLGEMFVRIFGMYESASLHFRGEREKETSFAVCSTT